MIMPHVPVVRNTMVMRNRITALFSTSCHPFYDEGMRFVHMLKKLSEEGTSDILEVERIEKRRKDAAKIRSIANVLRRYEDPNNLIPEFMSFADDLEGSAE